MLQTFYTCSFKKILFLILFISFIFTDISKTFFIIFVVRENIRVKLALTIPAGSPITVAKEIIDTPPIAADKTIKALSKLSKAAIYLQMYLPIKFLSWISEWK